MLDNPISIYVVKNKNKYNSYYHDMNGLYEKKNRHTVNIW